MSGGTGGTGGTARIDAWVWSVRLFKTRSAAAAACKAGHVKLNDATVKPAQTVAVGDRVRAWVNHREYVYEVTDLVTKRVGAPRARECYIDHSPPPPSKEILASIPRRDRGAGRPTKRERRQLDKLRGMD
ncbi:MAG TPA: RNA-binding S4 domain-containing protein [Candidatus Corynebacterium faecigallinarum]|uniref:RNA-binding S4 domain-containing protein n=1 Tax=Candidatus Corynebacterium faecigallinarum TaxID=2838528 RepID=A0A9D2QHT7_9CORY|nr:RNA-binding S4 domain-containing protein [Candidatus Corynebacterium faecigallinarum]